MFEIAGQVDVDRSKIGSTNWLKLGIEEWEEKLPANKEIQKTLEYIFRTLWYIHARNRFLALKDSPDCIEWMLRLLPFTDLHPRTELISITLNTLSAASDSKNSCLLELIGLYFQETPFELNGKLSRWKQTIAASNPTLITFISQAMKQPKPEFPQHFDPQFLQFTQNLLNLKLEK